ncbi:hypothetical protein ACFZBE_41355 [Streptomyces sp. NPDC008061]|uniref:hypothetical protein n=1 Tax=Streptomyces sp. NPDC008061 TaxID=3364805 RepID=UPI0036ED8034
MAAAEIGERLGFSTLVEVTSLASPAAGEGAAYLWVSRNGAERVPDQAVQAETLQRMHRLDGYQRALAGRFQAETETLLNKAADAGLRIVCNDPRGDWGSERVDAQIFTRLISNLFYYDALTAALMLQGTGYSTHGHYLFALQAPNGAQLCYFMIAEWPWGWERTYTILDGRYAGPSMRLGAARILMVLANALFLGRHGADTLVLPRGQRDEHAAVHPVRIRRPGAANHPRPTPGARQRRLG